MTIDSTFWVAVSFLIFFGGLIYLKVPQKINEILNKLILDIKNQNDQKAKLNHDTINRKLDFKITQMFIPRIKDCTSGAWAQALCS